MGCCLLLVPLRTRVQSKSSRAVDQKARDTPTNQIYLISLSQQLGLIILSTFNTVNTSDNIEYRVSSLI